MTLSAKRTLTLLTMDVLLITEISYAFYRSFTTKGDFSETFLHSYVPFFVPTIVVSLIIIQRLKRKERAAAALTTPSQV